MARRLVGALNLDTELIFSYIYKYKIHLFASVHVAIGFPAHLGERIPNTEL